MHVSKRAKLKPAKSQATHVLPETECRFGALDRLGDWQGHPQEVGEDTVALDGDQPKDLSKVRRIRSGVLSLYQAGKLSDAHLAAADRWHADWSRGTGHPLRASEARFLGVSLGGAGHADGIHCSTIDAATRFREAAAAVGAASTARLMAFVVDGLSLVAVAAKTGMPRQDLAGAIVADLERLAEFYAEVDRTWRARRPGRSA